LFGMYRALYLNAGNLLQQQSIIDEPRDIFWLEEKQVETLLNDQTIGGIKEIIIERKKTFEAYKIQDVPAHVEMPAPPVVAVNKEQDGSLTGTGCVAGIVTAEVIVITSPEDNLDVSGKIICALRTDPGWVALFPACKGVLIEKGSALSHSVILLREFGIPSIINIPGLTKALTSGQVVTMDGATGEITINEQVGNVDNSNRTIEAATNE
jgi:rifampicin phosphotransferase